MLCVRSASLTMITRMSRTMASSILRKLSACASARLLNWIWSSLLTPSTSSATSVPKRVVISSLAVGVSSMTSWRIAAISVCGVEPQVGEQVGDRDRVRDVGLARAAALALVGLEREVVGGLDPLDVLVGKVRLELVDQLVDADGPSSVGQQAAQGRRDVHGWLRRGSVSQAEVGRAQLAHELGLGDEVLRRAVRLLEDLEADVAGGDLAQRQHRRLVVLPVERRPRRRSRACGRAWRRPAPAGTGSARSAGSLRR